MQINLSGHHVEITEALRNHVSSKMERLERHSDKITDATVTLSVEKNRQKAEASVRLAGADVFAHHETDDMYASIDTMVDKLDRQIIKHKQKITSRRQAS